MCTQVNADVFMTCLSHALSTEREEVMGLLIGTALQSIHVTAWRWLVVSCMIYSSDMSVFTTK